jgi:excisionase family DNA binding protein
VTPRPITSSEEDPLLTPAEVGERFRVDRKTVGRWAVAGLIDELRTPGGHRRFRESDVRRMLGLADSRGDDGVRYHLWSNKHGMWWRPAACGYTLRESEAGSFTEEEAVRYVVRSAWSGHVDQVTCMVVVSPDVDRVASTPTDENDADTEELQ